MDAAKLGAKALTPRQPREGSQEDAPSPELAHYVTPLSYYLLHFPPFTVVSLSEAACLTLLKTKAGFQAAFSFIDTHVKQ